MTYNTLFLVRMVSPCLGLRTFLTGLVFPSKKSEVSARDASDLQELSLLVSQWLDKNKTSSPFSYTTVRVQFLSTAGAELIDPSSCSRELLPFLPLPPSSLLSHISPRSTELLLALIVSYDKLIEITKMAES